MAVSHGELVPSTCAGTVHSVYRSTVNLAVTRGAPAALTHDAAPFLVTLATADLADQPCTVRLRDLPDARPGSPFRIEDGTLHLGDATVPLRDGARWRAAKPAELGRALREGRHGLPARLAVVRDAAERRCAEVVTVLAPFSDPDRYSAGWVRRLVGLGPGLTPSGDDVLVGALLGERLVAAAFGPGAAGGLPARVLGTLERTGDVSAHLLRLAAYGHFSAPLLGLAAALPDPARDLDAALDTALSVGASSGADAAYGLVAALADLLADACLTA
ncbi:DUF2877 domain-containing protein [Dactylosporangium salmoneum]|uniref:DUF2877 domain-containing protein n=1 Tax=Dactylosporangium salmoneum TaxID=53361 RepID=A0ABN3GSD3_9ACTN